MPSAQKGGSKFLSADGHGEPGSESVLDCPPPAGYAPTDDDCLELDDTAYPGATEICDGRDNDCDNLSDERVKPTCGLGWCRRESWSCKDEDCTPGDPRPEECNAFDDDCDDSIDEGADCGPNLICQAGYCVTTDVAAGQSGAGGEAGASGQGSTAGQSGSTPADGTGGAPNAMEADAGSATPSSNASGCSVSRLRSDSSAELAVIYAIALWILSRRRARRFSRLPRRERGEPEDGARPLNAVAL